MAIFVLPPLWLAGCSHFKTQLGTPLVVDKVAFVAGKTSAQSVIYELGPSNQVTASPDGCVCLYEHSQIGETQVGLSVNLPVLRFLKFIKAKNFLQTLEMAKPKKNKSKKRPENFEPF